jgi:hypothetical protein
MARRREKSLPHGRALIREDGESRSVPGWHGLLGMNQFSIEYAYGPSICELRERFPADYFTDTP